MRTRLDKKHFTKPERIFGRLLQERGIDFLTKIKIAGREIDFVIGNITVEIDGHEQDGYKNQMLVQQGYTPIHFSNTEIYNNRELIINIIIKLCQQQTFQTE